jgi:hypothetical protein
MPSAKQRGAGEEAARWSQPDKGRDPFDSGFPVPRRREKDARYEATQKARDRHARYDRSSKGIERRARYAVSVARALAEIRHEANRRGIR